jgi:hypothetical protein
VITWLVVVIDTLALTDALVRTNVRKLVAVDRIASLLHLHVHVIVPDRDSDSTAGHGADFHIGKFTHFRIPPCDTLEHASEHGAIELRCTV